MIRLSEEQQAIISCYSGTKEDVIEELRKAIPFIEDTELKELTEDVFIKLTEVINEQKN